MGLSGPTSTLAHFLEGDFIGNALRGNSFLLSNINLKRLILPACIGVHLLAFVYDLNLDTIRHILHLIKQGSMKRKSNISNLGLDRSHRAKLAFILPLPCPFDSLVNRFPFGETSTPQLTPFL